MREVSQLTDAFHLLLLFEWTMKSIELWMTGTTFEKVVWIRWNMKVQSKWRKQELVLSVCVHVSVSFSVSGLFCVLEWDIMFCMQQRQQQKAILLLLLFLLYWSCLTRCKRINERCAKCHEIGRLGLLQPAENALKRLVGLVRWSHTSVAHTLTIGPSDPLLCNVRFLFGINYK